MALIDFYQIFDPHIFIWDVPPKSYLYDLRFGVRNRENPDIVLLTGWVKIAAGNNYCKLWFLDGYQSTAMEVFESLPEEERLKIIWELDEWK